LQPRRAIIFAPTTVLPNAVVAASTPNSNGSSRYSGALFLVQRALKFNLDRHSEGAIVGQTHLDAV
jgi:hypothetical protein